MKKGFNILMLIIGAMMLVLSCNRQKSYTDYLNDERKAINRLISEEGFEVINDFPASGVFKKDQFVRLSSGVYLNIIDSGNGNRAVSGRTIILARFDAQLFLDSIKYSADLFPLYEFPMDFKFGTSTSPNSNDPVSYCFLSPGLNEALNYVGDSSEVRLIVPFEKGSTYQKGDVQYQISGNYCPAYYKRVRFIFE